MSECRAMKINLIVLSLVAAVTALFLSGCGTTETTTTTTERTQSSMYAR